MLTMYWGNVRPLRWIDFVVAVADCVAVVAVAVVLGRVLLLLLSLLLTVVFATVLWNEQKKQ